MLPPPLPIPPLSWLEAIHAQQRKAEMEPQERPVRAVERWAEKNGQPPVFGALILSHAGGPAWKFIWDFYGANSALAREQAAPFLLSCFYYDVAFWPLYIPVAYGEGPFDPAQFIKEMPPPLVRSLRRDSYAWKVMVAHLADGADQLAGMAKVVDGGQLSKPAAKDFLDGANAMLASAAASLLSGQPNAKAAEHSRFAFESALKGFVVQEGVLTAEEVRMKVGHDLHKLLNHCRGLLDPFDHQRMTVACAHYPEVKARYANQPLPRTKLWACYAEACHTLAAVLRSRGGPFLHPSPPEEGNTGNSL